MFKFKCMMCRKAFEKVVDEMVGQVDPPLCPHCVIGIGIVQSVET